MTTANVSSLKAAVARVEELQATKPGIEAKKIRACLTLEDYSDKVIAEAMKTLGIKNNASGLMTFPAVINWLGEEPRTEEEFYKIILERATNNEARWINDRNVVRLMTLKVFEKAGLKFTDVAASAELKAKVKAKGETKTKA